MTTVPPVVVACVAGAIIGFLYTLSPLTLWFAVALVPLFAWGGRDLGRRERIWVLGLLGTALALRLLALVVLFLAAPHDGSFSVLIPDEGHMAYRARMLRYIALDIPLARQDYFESSQSYGWTGLHYAHAYLQLLVGEAPFAIRLPHIALYLTGCVALYRTVRAAFGAVAALGGFAVVLFLPSLFVWSISYLKDAPYQYLTAISVAGAIGLVRSHSAVARVLAFDVVVLAILSMGTVRPGGEIIVAGGVATGMLGAALLRRPMVLAALLCVCVTVAVAGLRNPQVQQRTTELLAQAAWVHAGFVQTEGWNYKLLDAGSYTRDPAGRRVRVDPRSFTPAATARYIIRATLGFFFVPLPWQAASPSILAYLSEQLVWNLLVLLGLIGVVAGLRRDPTLTLVLTAVIAFGAVAIGMTSGNIGTLVRHRAMVAMLLPWLSSLGVVEVLGWVARFRARTELADGSLPPSFVEGKEALAIH